MYDEFIPVFASFPIHKVDVLAPAAEAGKAPSSSKVEKKLRYINLYASAAVTSSGPGTCGFAVSLPGALNDEC